jgi:elongator complex protein 2
MLPKAVLQLAWRPGPDAGDTGMRQELAIAGEDSSLRLYSFGTEFLRGSDLSTSES